MNERYDHFKKLGLSPQAVDDMDISTHERLTSNSPEAKNMKEATKNGKIVDFPVQNLSNTHMYHSDDFSGAYDYHEEYVKNPDKFHSQPIIVTKHPDGTHHIQDGQHRFNHAYKNGDQSIKAFVFDSPDDELRAPSKATDLHLKKSEKKSKPFNQKDRNYYKNKAAAKLKKLKNGKKPLDEAMDKLDVKKSEWTNDPMSLSKGSLQAKNPYHPSMDHDSENVVENWIDGTSESGRDKIPKMSDFGLQRGTHKLHGQTQVRMNKESGEREFLLHRGMSQNELNNHASDGKYSNNGTSSWSPKLRTAHQFATDTYQGGHHVSAWIPESQIHHIPRQTYNHGGHNKTAPRVYEYEVIVKGAKADLHGISHRYDGETDHANGRGWPDRQTKMRQEKPLDYNNNHPAVKKYELEKSITDHDTGSRIRESHLADGKHELELECANSSAYSNSAEMLDKYKKLAQDYPNHVVLKESEMHEDDIPYHEASVFAHGHEVDNFKKEFPKRGIKLDIHHPPTSLKKTMTIAHAAGLETTKTGGAATEGLTQKPFAQDQNAKKLKSRLARIQAAKELQEKNPDEDWAKHIGLKKVEETMDKEKFLAKMEDLMKRSKNVRRELARINSGKKGEAKEIKREEKYAKDKAGIAEVKQSPNIGTIAQNIHGDKSKESVAAVTNADKKKAGWKKNKNGKYIHKPVISEKKDGTSSLTHIGTPKSIRHETAHVIRADDSITDLDSKMQAGFGKVKSIGGKAGSAAKKEAEAQGKSPTEVAAAKKQADKAGNPHSYQGEYETNGVENAIARRTGSLPPRNTVSRDAAAKKKYGKENDKNEKDPLQVGMNGAKKGSPIHKLVPEHTSMESSVVRRDRQAKQKAAAKKKGKEYTKPSDQTPKMIHIASLSDNVRTEIKTKVEQKLDTGEIKHNPKNGGKPEIATNIDAKINGRAAGRRDIKDDVKKPSKAVEKLAANEESKSKEVDVKSLLKSLLDKVSK